MQQGLPGVQSQVASNGVQQVHQQLDMLRAGSLPSNLRGTPVSLGLAGGPRSDALVEGLQQLSLAGVHAPPHAPNMHAHCLQISPSGRFRKSSDGCSF